MPPSPNPRPIWSFFENLFLPHAKLAEKAGAAHVLVNDLKFAKKGQPLYSSNFFYCVAVAFDAEKYHGLGHFNLSDDPKDCENATNSLRNFFNKMRQEGICEVKSSLCWRNIDSGMANLSEKNIKEVPELIEKIAQEFGVKIAKAPGVVIAKNMGCDGTKIYPAGISILQRTKLAATAFKRARDGGVSSRCSS